MTSEAITIRGLTKAFGRNAVLRGVDLDLPAGKVTVLMGANGAGKSTLVKVLCGIHAADAGEVRLARRPYAPAGPAAALRSGVVTVHQNINDGVVPDLDVASNLLLDSLAGGGALFLNRRKTREEARRIAAAVGLEIDVSRPVAGLTLADRQLVVIARAMAHRPRLLLLDEPTSSLDVVAKAEIRRDLVRLRDERPVTTIVVTHDPLDAFALADHVLVLEQGRVVQSGELDDVAAHPKSRHVADMVGLSILRGHVHDGVLTTPAGVSLSVPADTPSGPSIASIRPASVSLHRSKPEGSARNSWELRIHDLDRHPERVRVRLTGPFLLLAEITPAATEALALTVGDTVWASVKASEVSVSPDLGS